MTKTRSRGWGLTKRMGILFFIFCSFVAFALGESSTQAVFEKGINRYRSSSPPFVLIKVVHRELNQSEEVCLFASKLMTAICIEQGLPLELPFESEDEKKALAFVFAQKERTFSFSNQKALHLLKRIYTDVELEEARGYLKKYSREELQNAIGQKDSDLKLFISHQHGSKADATAHALIEKGMNPFLHDLGRSLGF